MFEESFAVVFKKDFMYFRAFVYRDSGGLQGSAKKSGEIVTKEILIFGAGGAGRELAFALSTDRDRNRSWEIKGFIDDEKKFWGKRINDIPVLGGIDFLRNYSGNLAITVFEDPVKRKALTVKIQKNKKIDFPVLICPTSTVSKYVEWGQGCIVNNHNVISTNTGFGDFVFVNSRSGVGHDTIVGDYTIICAGINIGGSVRIGSCCFVGSGATILPGVRIGNDVIIGAGAVVTNDLPSGVVAKGVPAEIFRKK